MTVIEKCRRVFVRVAKLLSKDIASLSYCGVNWFEELGLLLLLLRAIWGLCFVSVTCGGPEIMF